MTSPSLPERIARLALEAFDALPDRCKPRIDRQSGVREWIPMSAVVFARDDISPPAIHLVTLATGSKCLPANLLPRALGLVLHDCHSEILAIRGLNRFLLQEARNLLENGDYLSPFLARSVPESSRGGRPFHLHPSVTIHLFSTEPPCGDASMEFIMSAQSDAAPWPIPLSPSLPSDRSCDTTNRSKLGCHETATTLLPGRSYFSALSIVRRKPSRPDAPPTLSKSCTDKLTLKQFVSVLSAPAALLISPRNAYISTFTVPADKYNEEAYTRAFQATGRLATISAPNSDSGNTLEPGAYMFTPFTTTPLPRTFDYTYRYSKPPPSDTVTKTSNISALYINYCAPETGACSTVVATAPSIDVIISGVKQGNAQFSISRNDRKGTTVCRKKIWQLVHDIANILGTDELGNRVRDARVYADLKQAGRGGVEQGEDSERDLLLAAIQEREAVKQRVIDALQGWHRNRGDDDWGL